MKNLIHKLNKILYFVESKHAHSTEPDLVHLYVGTYLQNISCCVHSGSTLLF